MYDIIGDIHGYADQLELILSKLGYENNSGYYKHPERKVIFVGDFIDRGPKIRETLSIVKRMVDENSALATMGNHEFNALCYFTKNSDNDYIRIHSEKNFNQVKDTISQFEGYEVEWNIYFEWFKTLPVYLDLGDFRVIHACWDEEYIKHISNNKSKIDFSENFLIDLFSNKKDDLYIALDVALKGKEDKIPNRYFFLDKEKVKRYTNRVKWWIDPSDSKYNDYYFEEINELNGIAVDINYVKSSSYYGLNEVPVFCGHYWLKDKVPMIQTKNVACVDFSVAKGNILSAYRWSGERELKDENFIWV